MAVLIRNLCLILMCLFLEVIPQIMDRSTVHTKPETESFSVFSRTFARKKTTVDDVSAMTLYQSLLW